MVVMGTLEDDGDNDWTPRWTCSRSLTMSSGDVKNEARAPALALDKMVNERGSAVIVVTVSSTAEAFPCCCFRRK